MMAILRTKVKNEGQTHDMHKHVLHSCPVLTTKVTSRKVRPQKRPRSLNHHPQGYLSQPPPVEYYPHETFPLSAQGHSGQNIVRHAKVAVEHSCDQRKLNLQIHQVHHAKRGLIAYRSLKANEVAHNRKNEQNRSHC